VTAVMGGAENIFFFEEKKKLVMVIVWKRINAPTLYDDDGLTLHTKLICEALVFL
jgi:hypothetical protein